MVSEYLTAKSFEVMLYKNQTTDVYA